MRDSFDLITKGVSRLA
jgi:protein phosphatase PTC7